jgi:phage terminase Nu1 subunit (DNA packaging protein)
MTDEPVWRTAAEVAVIFGVQPRTVNMWAYRGHITQHGDRYNLTEVLDWWDNRRSTQFADLRARRD